MSGLNVHSKGFQQNQKRTDDLRTLVTTAIFENPSASNQKFTVETYGYHDAYVVSYPSDYMFEVGDSVRIKFDSVLSFTDTIEATIETLDRKLTNSLSEHHLHNGKARPIKVHVNNRIKLYCTKEYKINDYLLTYIKTPDKIVYSDSTKDVAITFLPEHAWDEITSIAVRLALENITDSRYSTYSQESQLVE